MKTSEEILNYIKEKKQVTARELVNLLLISERAIFKQLTNLLAEGRVVKIGKAPKVFYMIKEKSDSKEEKWIIDKKDKKIIDENYLTITASGERKEGLD